MTTDLIMRVSVKTITTILPVLAVVRPSVLEILLYSRYQILQILEVFSEYGVYWENLCNVDVRAFVRFLFERRGVHGEKRSRLDVVLACQSGWSAVEHRSCYEPLEKLYLVESSGSGSSAPGTLVCSSADVFGTVSGYQK